MNRLPIVLAVLLLAVSFILAKQLKPIPLPKTYDAAWKQIDSLSRRGLYQSALTQTNALYERAKAEKNYPQLIKVSLSRTSFILQLDREQFPAVIRSLEADICLTPEPGRSVLQSALGEAYTTFYQRNRYRIYDRSRVTEPTKAADSTDISSWDGPRIAQAAMRAFVASIQNERELQATPLSAYAPVIRPGNAQGERLRPTLFDLLAHRAIAFFQNTEFETENNVFRFELNRPDYFTDPETFARLTLTTPPNTEQTGRMLALQTYQRLLRFHAKQSPKSPEAFVDADLARLQFVRQYSTVSDRDTLYGQNLERQITRWKGQPTEAVYAVALINFLEEQAAQYNPLTKPAYKWTRKQAADISRDIIARFPKTRAAQQASLQLEQLTAPAMDVLVETVSEPNKPFLARVGYRNLSRFFYRIYRIEPDERNRFTSPAYQDEDLRQSRLTELIKKPLAAEATTTLPEDGDLNPHSVEVPINGLPIGYYVLLVSRDGKFDPKETTLSSSALIVVSQLGYVSDGSFGQNAPRTLYVTDRGTGQRLAGASVQVFTAPERYTSEPRYIAGEIRQTDATGRVAWPVASLTSNRQIYFRISRGNDVLFTDGQYIYPNQSQQQHDEQHVFFFTDRAIYRPGQPIYVKGLLYGGRNNKFDVSPDEPIELILRDANGEAVSTVKLTSNEYGSFTHTFTAPAGRLTGSMTIMCQYGQTQIRVEEYKRPTFAVTADTLRQAVRLGQTVSVSASAQTFAGAAVDGAQVRYRVARRYIQPLWEWGGWGRSIWPPRRSQPTEITNGENTTDASGALSFSFIVAPDATIERSSNPTFAFEVTIDVTDRQGETRSTTQTLNIGYTALQLSLTVPGQLAQGDAQTYAVKATNQAGVTVPIRQGEVVISRLQPPAQPLRKRLWERPDRQLLSQAEFKRLFPNEVYADEDNPANWPRQQILTAQPQSISLRDLPAGEYVAEVSVTDQAGERGTHRQFFSVVSNEVPSARPDAWVVDSKTAVLPGEEAVFYVGNSQPGWVLMTITETNQQPRSEWVQTNGKPKHIAIPVTERQRGGFGVQFAMIQNGRLLTHSATASVPFTNKQLTIETLTFRDKLKPGQADEWTIRISGPDKDKVAAEMVATLYDASLDEFVQHQWQVDVYSNYQSPGVSWVSRAFETTSALSLSYYQEQGGPKSVRFAAQPVVYPSLLSIRDDQGVRYLTGAVAKQGRGDYAAARAAAPMADNAMVSEAKLMSQDRGGRGASPNAEESADESDQAKQPTVPQPVIRKNFNETAFFFPQLRTDAEGRILLKFTMPDALTRWKLLAFAHTKDVKTGLLTREIVTQKELMVSLNPPRFLREQDTIRFTARINNLTAKPLSGTARLEAFDAMTEQPLSASVNLSAAPVSFSAGPNGSTSATWAIVVPTGLPPVAFRVSATAGSFTDAEERVVPVLPNRMLVTDALPFWVNGNETRAFTLSALTGLSVTSPVQHERLTVEVTSNPIWTALQSLPYLIEYPYECSEQLASRLYANYLASQLIDSRPEFRRVVDSWAANPPQSPLATNAELKAVTLENSPWLADARSEQERTALLGELFNKNRLATEQRNAVDKLQELQAANGGFAWFKGMRPDLTITLHILTNLGRMEYLSRTKGQPAVDVSDIQKKAVQFADNEMKQWIVEHKKQKNPSSPAYLATQYLYARNLTTQAPALDNATRTYLVKHIAKNWTTESLQGQAMAVLALGARYSNLIDKSSIDPNEYQTARAILASLKERAKESDELGMFWPENQPGTSWYEAPIETQAYLIEAFSTVGKDKESVQEMTKWLLRQKQTQSWPSTKATTEAINAMLLGPVSAKAHTIPLQTGVTATVLVGGQSLSDRVGKEGSSPLGYQKTIYNPTEIRPELGKVQIAKEPEGPAWGALYWQRFEPLDKVKVGSTSLSVQKTLYLQRDTPKGPVIEPVSGKTALKPGALVKVRLVIKNDRLLEYVHVKDSRASGFEPVAVLSGYKHQNGLGYYEAPRDASTDFFISRLPIGTHVFEYDLRVVQPGDFSAGVATIQCFYAPEFSAHSAGTRVRVR